MDIQKQVNGNISLFLSDREIIDALEEYFGNVYGNITETAVVQKITNWCGRTEIIIGDNEE